MAEAPVDLGEVGGAQDLPAQFPVLLFEGGDAVEADLVDVAGVEFQRGEAVHRPAVVLFAAGEPADARLLLGTGGGEHVGGDGGAVAGEGGADDLLHLFLHGPAPPRHLPFGHVGRRHDGEEGVLVDGGGQVGVELREHLLDGHPGRRAPRGHALEEAVDGVVERGAQARGLHHVGGGVFGGDRRHLGDVGDQVHVGAEHRVHQELGVGGAEGVGVGARLEQENLAGDLVGGIERGGVEGPGRGDDAIEVGDEAFLLGPGGILDAVVEAVVAQQGGEGGLGPQEEIPVAVGQGGEIGVHNGPSLGRPGQPIRRGRSVGSPWGGRRTTLWAAERP